MSITVFPAKITVTINVTRMPCDTDSTAYSHMFATCDHKLSWQHNTVTVSVAKSTLLMVTLKNMWP